MALHSANRRTLLTVAVLGIALVLVFLGTEAVFAGPGGFIKAASKTFWGKVVMAGLIAFFMPLIIWYLVRRRILVRRTQRALRQLGETVPHFEWMQLRDRIAEVFLWVHSAWDLKKMELASDHVTPWYVQNQQLLLEKWEREGLENVVSDVQIKTITPVYVAHSPDAPGRDRVVAEIDAEMRDYLVEKATGKVVRGDKTLGHNETVWSFVRDGDQWVLNRIEASASAMDYLAETDKVPVPAREPAT
jgi:hypothetical protein